MTPNDRDLCPCGATCACTPCRCGGSEASAARRDACGCGPLCSCGPDCPCGL